MVTCKVFFNKSDKKYKAGDILQLRIILNVTKQLKARLLSVRFLGKGHTEWQVSTKITEVSLHHTVYESYTANEEYFRRYKNLLGKQGGVSFIVEPGKYEYNVSFDIPQNSPSSFEHKLGYIRYDIKVKYDAIRGCNESFRDTFTVQSKVDLNTDSYLRDPIKISAEKTFGCCCWESEPLDLVTKLSRRAWVPGESMLIDVEVHNNSGVSIDWVSIRLKERLTFVTNSPFVNKKTETNKLNNYRFPSSVPPYQKRLFKYHLLLDPNYDWKIFPLCRFIQCDYFIETEAESSGCHTNLENSTIVIIGTEPLKNVPNEASALTSIPSSPSASLDIVCKQPLPSYYEETSIHSQTSSSKIE